MLRRQKPAANRGAARGWRTTVTRMVPPRERAPELLERSKEAATDRPGLAGVVGSVCNWLTAALARGWFYFCRCQSRGGEQTPYGLTPAVRLSFPIAGQRAVRWHLDWSLYE